jgi:PilZ domain-containing protein
MEAEDRRRHPRVRLDGRTGGRATVFADFRVVALSESGAELEMAVPLAMGSQCDITLNLAHGSVDVKGRVVAIQDPAAPENPYHVGVDFVSVEALDQALLQSFLERERRKAL